MSIQTSEPVDIRKIPGLVATVVLGNAVTPQYAEALSNMRSYNDRNGLHKVEYKNFYAVLVESGRDSAVRHMLEVDKGAYQWLLQIDADAAPFPQDALQRMLELLFVHMPGVDAVGGYCQLKGGTNLPTIDTGTGTWEEHYPGGGVIPVIRTGAHFLLCKRSAFIATGPPWFRTRLAASPLRALRDVDNFARTKLDGRNPLEDHPEWETLMHAAFKSSPGYGETHVGEDSGFFDKLKSVGRHVVVDTDLVVGHVGTWTILPDDFKEQMQDRLKAQRAAIGIGV
jgi:hypothetical protein